MNATKYRKKPVEIQAIQWLLTNAEDIRQFMGVNEIRVTAHGYSIPIETLEGVMLAAPDDYIIRGVQGEFYPCKPDIFAATYDPVDEVPA